jgi:hypothetical protein
MVTNARTIYIDHSVVSREAWWPSLNRALEPGDLRLVLSLWNLFEIGAAKDKSQQRRRLNFLQQFNPMWAVERRAIQKQEVKRFLWSQRFATEPEELVAITPALSVVDYFLSGTSMRIGLTAEQFISETDYGKLNPLKLLSPEAQATMKAADPAALKEKDREIFTGWVGQSIPVWGPSGKLLTEIARSELAEYCFQNRPQFLASCPSMAVEDAVTTDRTADQKRQPQDSDGPDLQHAAVAMAYCDIFLTGDGYQARTCCVARRALKGMRLAQVYTNPDQLVQAIPAMPA